MPKKKKCNIGSRKEIGRYLLPLAKVDWIILKKKKNLVALKTVFQK